MRPPFSGGLFLLALRRSLPAALWAPTLLFLALAATRSWSPPAPIAGDPDAARSASAFVRHGVWATLGLFALPIIVFRAAAMPRRWRRRDASWIAPTPVARSAAALSGFLGAWTGAGLLVLAAALAAEAAIRDAGAALRVQGVLESPAVVLSDDDGAARWELRTPRAEELAAGTLVRIRPTVAPGSGPAVTVLATLSAGDGSESTRVARRVFGRTVLDLEVPPTARGALRFTLARMGPGAVLVLPARASELLVPARSERLASLELALRTWLALGAWLALAVGLGAWMRPGLAALATLAIVVAAARWSLARPLVPGSDLISAWELVGRGLVPPSAGLGVWIGLALALLLGAGLVSAGLAQRRFVA